MGTFTQLEGLAQHLGRWEGRFIQLDPCTFTPISRRQSLITFERLPQGGISQTNVYFDVEETIDDARPGQRWIYHDLAAGLRFFPDGSFSNGRLQLAPFSEFAAEQGFLWKDRKARVVTQFDPQGYLKAITLILEVRGRWTEPDPAGFGSVLAPDQIPRSWQGETICYRAADLIPSEPDQSRVTLSGEPHPLLGNLWLSGARQVPDPLRQRDRSFCLELGWMPEPQVFLHLRREYDPSGAWQALCRSRTRSA